MRKKYLLILSLILIVGISWFVNKNDSTAPAIAKENLAVKGETTEQKHPQVDVLPLQQEVALNKEQQKKLDPKDTHEPFNPSTPASLSEIETYGGQLLWGTDYGVEGEGLVIGLWEARQYPDTTLTSIFGFPSRITLKSDTTVARLNSHADNVARSLLGNGIPVADQGIARKALAEAYLPESMVNSKVEADLRNRLADTFAPIMLVSNHSYAPTEGWVTNTFWRSVINVDKEKAFRFGRYGSRDSEFDAIVYDYPYHTLVMAAGNSRGKKYGGAGTIQSFEYDAINGTFSTYNYTGADPIPEEQDFDCIVNGNLGKNIITVGAVGTVVGGYLSAIPSKNNVSAIGPTDDGRIKPDLVAPSGFRSSGAAPQVSGSALLLQELNFKNKGHYLLASTIKALFIHTAFPMSTGPSYEFGWGAIQPTVAADFILSSTPEKQVLEANLENGQAQRYYLYLDGDFKSTLVWTDPAKDETPLSYVPADLNKDYITLVNDLDMRLRPISDYASTGEQPWILDKDNPADPATKGNNLRDNVEQLDATGLAAGWYELEINHKGTLLDSDPQAYSLIIEGAENGNCLVTNRPEPEQTYSGGAWSVTEATGKHTYIRENVTLSSGTSVIKDLIADPNTIITLNHNLEITGNLVLGKDVQFDGSGTITFSGVAAQTTCGCAMDSLIIDNTNGVSLSGNPTVVTDGLKLKTGTFNTNGLLTLRGKQGVAAENRYAQLEEAGGTINGAIRFESWIEGPSGWRHIALPVATTVKEVVSNFTFYTLNPAGPSIMRWNAATATWEAPQLNDALPAGTPLAVYFGTSPGGTEFTPLPFLLSVYGIPGSGTQNNTLTYGAAFPDANAPPTQSEAQRTGWNFIGNPYPQNLDWKTVAEDITGTDVSNAYYFWNGTSYLARAGANASDDGTGDAPLQIAPMKGFFVKAEDAAASSTSFFNFTNTDRTSVRGVLTKKGQEQLKLLATAENATEDAFFIAFSEAPTATAQFDPQHDAYKLMSPLEDVVQIFQSPNIDENIPALAIQVLPSGVQKYTLPVTVYYKNAETVTLKMDRSDWPESEWVFFIENLESEEWYNLESDYSFQSKGTPQHFLLHLFSSSQVVPPQANENEAFIWFNRNEQLAITVHQDENIQEVKIYNMSGQLLFNGNDYFDSEITIDKQALSGYGQFIIVEVITDKAVYTKRVFKP